MIAALAALHLWKSPQAKARAQCYYQCMAKKFIRRWRGFTEKEVSERMSMIAKNRFKSNEEKIAFSRAGVEARGSWEIIDGERKYVRRKN